MGRIARAETSVRKCYSTLHNIAEEHGSGRFGDVGHGLAPYDPVQSDLVQCGPVQWFINKFKMTSHS
jgi:hypothetical protein